MHIYINDNIVNSSDACERRSRQCKDSVDDWVFKHLVYLNDHQQSSPLIWHVQMLSSCRLGRQLAHLQLVVKSLRWQAAGPCSKDTHTRNSTALCSIHHDH